MFRTKKRLLQLTQNNKFCSVMDSLNGGTVLGDQIWIDLSYVIPPWSSGSSLKWAIKFLLKHNRSLTQFIKSPSSEWRIFLYVLYILINLPGSLNRKENLPDAPLKLIMCMVYFEWPVRYDELYSCLSEINFYTELKKHEIQEKNCINTTTKFLSFLVQIHFNFS